MLLPNGISSFFEIGNCPDTLDVNSFKKISCCFANINCGKLLSIDTSLSAKNFYTARISSHDKYFYFLTNNLYKSILRELLMLFSFGIVIIYIYHKRSKQV